jgi:hypothetical protein
MEHLVFLDKKISTEDERRERWSIEVTQAKINARERAWFGYNSPWLSAISSYSEPEKVKKNFSLE